jgi:hypothetical protein
MNQSQFDTVARLFAARRSRRGSLAMVGAGAAALGLAKAAAQDASPAASPVARETSDAKGTEFLFVQTFGAGSLGPKEDDPGTLVLTADHLAGQTLYFSDRPERIVGMVSTEAFLGASGTGGLGFTPSDPPNAALVFASADGSASEIVVVELIDPTYDAATGTVTYEVNVLDDVTSVDMQLEQATLSAESAVRDFEAASLFIDDCPDGEIYCIANGNNIAVIDSGFCYDWGRACCYPCAKDDLQYWTDYCNNPNNNSWDCNGQCQAQYREEWQCPS